MEYVKFTDIKPADYNPRRISDSAFAELKGSLKTLGFILPIIVNRENMTIVAGHQRTKAAMAIGLTEAPCYYVSGIDIESEVRFNQVHNGIELEPDIHSECLNVRAPGFYDDIAAEDFIIKDSKATIVKDMCQLMVNYGNALCAIVIGSECVFGNNYIKAAKITGMPIHCCFVEESKRAMFEYYFNQDYGVFSYDHIERGDFVQGLAQPPRLKVLPWSCLYEIVVPHLQNEDRKSVKVFDFGCGKAQYITKLHKQLGYRNAIGLEFFNHNTVGISVEHGQEMVDDFIAFVKANGKFDYVICDAVINSVNTQEAEDAVLMCLNLFCKMGGKIFISGRNLEYMKQQTEANRNTTPMMSINFFDENGLTAIMKQGQWFFQKFLTDEDVDKIIKRMGFDVFVRKKSSGYFFIGAYKTKDFPKEEYAKAVDYEFNLKLPNNRRYNRHGDVKELFGLI
jgi:ParB family chromosome partitioning protein